MNTRSRAAAAGAVFCAAGVLFASAAQAATVVQTHSFDIVNVVTQHPSVIGELAIYDAENPIDTLVAFDPFDPSLGALTAVELTLSGGQDFATGVSVAVPDGASHLAQIHSAGTYTSDVRLGGLSLDPYDLQETLGEQICFNYVDACIDDATAHRDTDLDTLVANLGAFVGGPVNLDLGSDVWLSADSFIPFAPAPVVTVSSGLVWSGQASLTYVYSPVAAPPPVGVPEPAAWALMLAGFGLAGATLRHRRATA